jgi:hypothetical protein
MRKFKLASLLLITILLTNLSFAQTDSSCTKDQIQFHFLNTYSVSYLNMLTQDSGLRFKLSLWLNGSNGNKESSGENYYSSNNVKQVTKSNGSNDENSSSQYFDFNFSYMMYHRLNSHLDLFLGGGPLISYSRYNSESTYKQSYVNTAQTTDYNNSYMNFNRSISVGFQLTAGIELQLTHALTLLAEYNLAGTYSWNKDSYESSSVRDQNGHKTSSEGTSWNYNLSNVKLGIAYRF